MVSVKWHGLEKLTMTISNAHPNAVKLSIAVLKNNGERTKAVAKKKAPEDTGFLKIILLLLTPVWKHIFTHKPDIPDIRNMGPGFNRGRHSCAQPLRKFNRNFRKT